MTKKEAHEFLKNKKVYVGRHSREIQEKLFEAGFEWAFEETVQHIDKPYLYTDDSDIISYGVDTRNFYFISKQQEITAEEILAIEIDEEHVFKPFDKVLWRADKIYAWKAGIYSNATNDDTCYIIGFGYISKNCIIPYKGNEIKLGKVTD